MMDWKQIEIMESIEEYFMSKQYVNIYRQWQQKKRKTLYCCDVKTRKKNVETKFA